MQEILHLSLDIENEFSAVEELPKRKFGVELARDLNVDLPCNLLELYDPMVFHQPVRRRPIQRVRIVGRRDRQ